MNKRFEKTLQRKQRGASSDDFHALSLLPESHRMAMIALAKGHSPEVAALEFYQNFQMRDVCDEMASQKQVASFPLVL